MLRAAVTLTAAAMAIAGPVATGQIIKPGKTGQEDKFRQLDELLPTPNVYRTASGAPGAQYWQQKVDYVIDAELIDDESNPRLVGEETITYFNQSPDTLTYLWLQLDRNQFTPDSDAMLTQTGGFDGMSFGELGRMLDRMGFDGGYDISFVTDGEGEPLDHTVVKTMMRVDLPFPLAPGESFEFRVGWSFNINDTRVVRSRTGAEWFEDDENYLYEMAHWFPRLAAYTDYAGWQHKQFLGRGEFTLEFGDYDVNLTVPSDHIVTATGELTNDDEVLTAEQRERLAEARETYDSPVFIVTPEEAAENEETDESGTKTWRFRAERVRDFAFASSRKFAWDAMAVDVGTRDVMAMSLYPNEGEPLWSRYSTHSIAHTLHVYGRYSFEYPYPVAISVNGPVGGMEYPMICFNGPRPEEDGTYTLRTKYGLISVIIHEVGHFFFPMIVNSDERQWTWMDEGLNTFLQFLTEQEWEDGYPSRRGEPQDITGFMASDYQVPIMTNSESILQFGANSYAKPATALNVLRETVLGRELFDYAFREYSRRWRFKRPEPADFFRTMEDASGVDLDWFWRGWFYTTDHVDIAVESVERYDMGTLDPEFEADLAKAERDAEPVTLSASRNAGLAKYVDDRPELLDFYNTYDRLDATPADVRAARRLMGSLDERQRELLNAGKFMHVVTFRNDGGLVMPLIVELHFAGGGTQEYRIPAEIWRRDHNRVSKVFTTDAPVVKVVLDPHLETADVDLSNNAWPPEPKINRFDLYKQPPRNRPNPMRDAREERARSVSGG